MKFLRGMVHKTRRERICNDKFREILNVEKLTTDNKNARRAGSDVIMSASGSAGPGFNPRRGSKFSFENFQPRG